MEQTIDFVVTWVDGNDPKWRKKRQQFALGTEKSNFNADSRFRDMGTFRYWFRAVEKYAPWVHQVYLVTDNQCPSWLNIECPKLTVVDHKEIISKDNLPTFNSNAIELSFEKIPGLTEQFVLFNDDTFINRPLSSDFFFDSTSGLPRDTKAYDSISPTQGGSYFSFNDLQCINQIARKQVNWKEMMSLLFGGNLSIFIKNLLVSPHQAIMGYYDSHMPISYLKSSFKRVHKRFPESWEATVASRFRNNANINHLLIRYFQLEKVGYVYRNPKMNHYYSINDLKAIEKDIRSQQHSLICINDDDTLSEEHFDRLAKDLAVSFQKVLPTKSIFER